MSLVLLHLHRSRPDPRTHDYPIHHLPHHSMEAREHHSHHPLHSPGNWHESRLGTSLHARKINGVPCKPLATPHHLSRLGRRADRDAHSKSATVILFQKVIEIQAEDDGRSCVHSNE